MINTPVNEHRAHGKGDSCGLYECDCSCRETIKQQECAKQGCGFCSAAILNTKTKLVPIINLGNQ